MYAIRETTSEVNGRALFYVCHATRKRSDNQVMRLSVMFPTRARAERCLAVLIADDARLERLGS